jgi:hypothetical protein
MKKVVMTHTIVPLLTMRIFVEKIVVQPTMVVGAGVD